VHRCYCSERSTGTQRAFGKSGPGLQSYGVATDPQGEGQRLPTGRGEVLQRFTFEAGGLNYDSWFVRSDWLPPNELTSTAFGLVFDRDAILLTRLVERGWDVPGGHLEAGETAAEANAAGSFRRDRRRRQGHLRLRLPARPPAVTEAERLSLPVP
jgi:hypothetical protein